jgi:hypothetical protein
MTLICRAKFERDDLNEAMIICGCHSHDIEAEAFDSKHDRENGDVDVEYHPMKQPRTWETWRGPHTFPFSYAASPPHAHRNTGRHPIPFENAVLYTHRLELIPLEAIEYHAESIMRNAQLRRDVIPHLKILWSRFVLLTRDGTMSRIPITPTTTHIIPSR